MIELMLVVAIIAILAVVVIPQFMKETTKAKRRSEVSAMFAEIAAKQEQFKIEKNYYLGNVSGTNYVGNTVCPTSVPTADYDFATSCAVAGSAWLMLRVVAPQQKLRCQYKILTDVAGTTMTAPTGFTNSAGSAAIASGWYYLYAECDEKGDGGTNATYFMNSFDRKLQIQNEGK